MKQGKKKDCHHSWWKWGGKKLIMIQISLDFLSLAIYFLWCLPRFTFQFRIPGVKYSVAIGDAHIMSVFSRRANSTIVAYWYRQHFSSTLFITCERCGSDSLLFPLPICCFLPPLALFISLCPLLTSCALPLTRKWWWGSKTTAKTMQRVKRGRE